MSWLGVDLNTIKGQISNLTKEVFTDDGYDDEEEKILVRKKVIKDLESEVYDCKQEIEILRRTNADLQSHQSGFDSNLKDQLNIAQVELQDLKRKEVAWNWGSIGNMDSTPSLHPYSEADSALVERVELLERQLLEERRSRHEAEVRAREATKPSRLDSNASTEAHPTFENAPADNEAAATLSVLQTQLASLTEKLLEADDEKVQLNASLEDLDHQNEMVVDQLLKSKAVLSQELATTKATLLKAESEVSRLAQLLQRESLSQIASGGNDEEESSSLQEKLKELSKENERLVLARNEAMEAQRNSHLKENDRLASLRQQYEASIELKDDVISKLEECLECERSRAERLGEEIVESNARVEGLAVHQTELTKLRVDVSVLTEENHAMKVKLLNTETEFRNHLSNVDTLNNKLMDQEEKILKYEAVMEEKDLDHSNLFSRLQQQEVLNRSLCQEFDREKNLLLGKLHEVGLRKNHSSDDNVLHQIGHVEDVSQLPKEFSDLESDIASLRSERDHLTRELETSTRQLKDCQDMYEIIEVEKGDLERECEDLRDQLEQQCGGGRQTPEGSSTPFSLPTIEEEEIDLGAAEEKGVIKALKPRVDGLEEDAKKEKKSVTKGCKRNLKSEFASEEPGKLNEEGHQQMQAELDKIRGLLVYKDDQLDHLKLSIQSIKQIFNIEEMDCREACGLIKRNYDDLQAQLMTLQESKDVLTTNSVTDDEKNIEELERSKTLLANAQDDLESARRQRSELELNLKEALLKNEEIRNELEAKVNSSFRLMDENVSLVEQLNAERNKSNRLENEIEEINAGNERMISELAEEKERSGELLCEKVESLSGENEKYLSKIEALKIEMGKLASNQISETRVDAEDKVDSAVTLESLNEELKSERDEKETLLQDRLSLEKELDLTKSTLTKDYENLSQLVSDLQKEKKQLIITSTQKHQEAVSYYAEIQRLAQLIQVEKQRSQAIADSFSSQLAAKSGEVVTLQNEVKELTLKLQEQLRQFNRVKEIEQAQSSSRNEVKLLQEEVRSMNDRLLKQEELLHSVERERDQLRLANDSFNKQYQEQTNQVAELLEAERRLSQECSRLRQHLVEVEEAYTSEAIQSEQREVSLRQSVAKLHEKMASHSSLYSSTKEKSTAQLEVLQEKVEDLTFQRDDVLHKLHATEEASLQHQEALMRLQQVLHDFQRSQSRDIALGIEREKKKCSDEKERNEDLEIEVKKLQGKITTLETSLSSNKSLRDDLQTKEDTCIALQSQVHSMQLAVRKTQDQVVSLQTNSDGKVDKNLIRNLVVGYFATPGDKRREVLYIISQVLDFSVEERIRTGIDTSPGSWLSSLANFLAPPPSNMRVASKVEVLDHSTLSQAFIRFLEEESAPRLQPQLPAVQMAEETQRKAMAKSRSQTNPLFMGADGSPSTDMSSSPILLATTIPLSLSPLQPVSRPEEGIGEADPPSVEPVAEPASAANLISQPKYLSSLLNSSDSTKSEILNT